MRIEQFTFNPFQENTYLLIASDGVCAIVDPGCYGAQECEALSEYIDSNGLRPERLLHTHCHLDHMFGNRYVAERYNLIPEHHPLETLILKAAVDTGIRFGLPVDASPEGDPNLVDGMVIQFGDLQLDVLHTPGHSPGSVCFYHSESGQLIGGDVLFRESIGRSDLPGGDHQILLRSIRDRLFILPEKTTVYPGHGESTSIGYEILNNPFMQ
ncbi:MAG: MBL fold metallo-hydrolase [Bacteroidota bacterium]